MTPLRLCVGGCAANLLSRLAGGPQALSLLFSAACIVGYLWAVGQFATSLYRCRDDRDG